MARARSPSAAGPRRAASTRAVPCTSARVRPLEPGGVGAVDLAVMVALSVALVPLLWTGFRLDRLEGALLLLAYSGYTAHLLIAVA